VKYIQWTLNWITTLVVPVTLILLVVRILLTPLYINVEYRMPGFPEDSYGFTFDERLYWADISRRYLLNQEDISFLGDQSLDENTPLYNRRELNHMYDVKVVVQGAIIVLYACFLFLVLYGFWVYRTNRWQSFRYAISRGGQFTIGLILLILFYLAVNFNSLFTNFHRIFFEGDTWLFRYSDTLIRLFPVRFWRDAFIWIATMVLLGGFGLVFWREKGKFANSKQDSS